MAKKDDYLNHLRSVPLFADCTKSELDKVARQVTPITIDAGTRFITEGAEAQEMMIIMTGTATVRRKGRKVAELGPGAVVGELALMLERPRDANVTADTDLSVLVLDRREFAGLLDDIPGFARRLLHTMAARLAEASRQT